MISGILKSIKNTFSTKPDTTKDTIIETVKTTTGKTIYKKYIKRRKLGSGAFAECYLTENMQTKKVYATKIIAKNAEQRTKVHSAIYLASKLIGDTPATTS